MTEKLGTITRRPLTTATVLTLYDEQRAVLAQVAKETGRTRSGAARFIINDWVNLKRAALANAAPPPLQDQDQPA